MTTSPAAPTADMFDPQTYPIPDLVRDEALRPALIVHLDHTRENIRRTLAVVGGDPNRWRPHLKTAKIPEVWAGLTDAGIRQFKCATTREAACLLDLLRQRDIRGADLLVAYPLVGPNRRRLAELATLYPETTVAMLADTVAAVHDIPAHLGVFVDLDPGFNRTGIEVGDVDAVAATVEAAGDRFRGLHCFDGHIRMPDPDERAAVAHALYERLVDLIDALAQRGIVPAELITSGTRTFHASAGFAPFRSLPGTLHRIAPGTVIMYDLATRDLVPEVEGTPAATVMARVVSRPRPNIITCDAGSKSMAAEAGDPVAIVVGRPDLIARRPTEEHLTLETTTGVAPERGEALCLIPRHVCPTINLAERAILVDGGAFAGVVPVAARAHELGVATDGSTRHDPSFAPSR